MQRLEELFHRLLELAPGERDPFLDRVGADDPDLRAQLMRLLAAAGDPDTLDGPTLRDLVAGQEAVIQEGPGSWIDRYKLLEVLGEGGFGVVYMAEQTEPVSRRVALKIIKLGMDSREVVARFEAERQALAMMDHPHIARVLDGGATATGRPYFVMELVRGVPITEFCDRSRLGPTERLELFGAVCRAVQHAHHKGVIHRDIKPSNVLVTLHDGVPVPKVIDFGIAKAMHGHRLTERTLFTQFQQFIGTPAYMSPEQAELSGLDVDTRSDIYSLGVLLYELLTGSTPIEPDLLLRSGLSALQRALREEPVQRPSLRISTAGTAEIAASRGGDVPVLSKRLRGDLDWIVLKALEKDRQRRYESAGAFAEDIERHLAQLPVRASPPGAGYRLRKFVARNRALVTAGGTVFVALLLGVVGTSLGLREASGQRDLAQAKAASFESVTDYLIGMLSLGDPRLAMRTDLSVRELLELSAERATEVFAGEPGSEARVRSAIGRAYLSLGEHREADRQLRRAVALFESMPDPDGMEYYRALWAQTNVAFKQESPEGFGWARRARAAGLAYLAEGEPELAARWHDFHHPIEGAATRPDPAPLIAAADQLPDLLAFSQERLPAGDPRWAIVAETCMAAGYWTWYTVHEVIGARYFEAALSIQLRELPPGNPNAVESLALLCGMLSRSGQGGEAARLLETTIVDLRRVLAPDNFQRAFIESMLGDALVQEGRYREAEELLLPAHRVLAAGVPRETDFYLQDSFARVVNLYQSWGKEAEAAVTRRDLAERLARGPFRSPWPITRRAFGPEHESLAADAERINAFVGGSGYAIEDDTVDCSALADPIARVARYLREAPSRDLPAVLLARLVVGLGAVFRDADRGLALAEGARQVLSGWEDEIPVDRAAASALCAEYLVMLDRGDEADQRALEGLRALEVSEGPEHWFVAVYRARIARGLLRAGLRGEARPLLEAATARLQHILGADHPQTEAAARLRAAAGTDGN